jgi:hypothetical protein
VWEFSQKKIWRNNIYNSIEQGPFWDADGRSASQEIPPPLLHIEPESSKEPAIGPCYEPNESSPHPHIIFL